MFQCVYQLKCHKRTLRTTQGQSAQCPSVRPHSPARLGQPRNATLPQNTSIYLMLSNIGSKQRFPCQQFRAPSQPVTLQSASFGYGYTDSRSLCLEKLKLFIKVHTRVLKHRQECDRWVQRTSPYPCEIKNSRFHYSTCDVSYQGFFPAPGCCILFLTFSTFFTSSVTVSALGDEIQDASGATFVFAAVFLWLVILSHVLLYFAMCCGRLQMVFQSWFQKSCTHIQIYMC